MANEDASGIRAVGASSARPTVNACCWQVSKVVAFLGESGEDRKVVKLVDTAVVGPAPNAWAGVAASNMGVVWGQECLAMWSWFHLSKGAGPRQAHVNVEQTGIVRR